MDALKELKKAAELPKEHRFKKLDQLMDQLRKRDAITIKQALDGARQILTDERDLNLQILAHKEEIDRQIRAIEARKEELKEEALECSVEEFKIIEKAIESLNEREEALLYERDELGDLEEDSSLDKQKSSTVCESWGNQSSVIDAWGGIVFRLKVLLNQKLDEK